ncbi:MAG: heparinase II/III family protein [Bryobacteraceae bacterium]
MLRIVPVVLLAAAAQGAVPVARPRLILTPGRIRDLKALLPGARAQLWAAALASAREFAAASPPEMRRADNRFRVIGETMPALGLAHHMTGDPAHAAAAVRWLRALVEVKEWSGSQNLGRSAWLLGSALLYDWLHGSLDAPTREAVRKRLEAEGAILLGDDRNYWRLLSNHCLIEISALGMAGLALEGDSDAAAVFVAKARERTALVIEHAPPDGAWSEGAQYWEYGTSYFLRWLEALKTSGTADYYPDYNWLRQTGYFAIYFSLPGLPGGAVNFGDCCSTEAVNRWRSAFLTRMAAAIYRNGHVQDYAARLGEPAADKFSWMDFIVYDPSLKPSAFRALPPTKHFEDSGFFLMRSSWRDDATLVGFRCGPAPGHRNQRDPRRVERRGFGPGHQHPDINSFSIYAHGQWLAIDPGYVHKKLTADHNTVLVNGLGQAGEGSQWLDFMAFESREPAPAIVRAESRPAYDYVIGDAGNIYVDEARLARFRRHLLFLKPDVVVISDDLRAKAPSRFEWLLHALDTIRPTAPGRFEIREGGVRLSVVPVLPGKHESATAERPYRASNVRGKLATLTLRADGAAAGRFLVVLAIHKDGASPAPQVTYSSGRLAIRHAGRSWRVAVEGDGGLRGEAVK